MARAITVSSGTDTSSGRSTICATAPRHVLHIEGRLGGQPSVGLQCLAESGRHIGGRVADVELRHTDIEARRSSNIEAVKPLMACLVTV